MIMFSCDLPPNSPNAVYLPRALAGNFIFFILSKGVPSRRAAAGEMRITRPTIVESGAHLWHLDPQTTYFKNPQNNIKILQAVRCWHALPNITPSSGTLGLAIVCLAGNFC